MAEPVITIDSDEIDLSDLHELEDDEVVAVTVGALRSALGTDELIPVGDVIGAQEQAHRALVEEAIATARKRPAARALDAERHLLGAILMSPSVLDDVEETGLTPLDFYREQHRWIYESILRLARGGEPVDVIHVVEELLRRNKLDACGGAAAISQLEAALPSSAHAEGYARIVREKASLRLVAEASHRAAARAEHADGKAADIIDEAQRALATADGRVSSKMVDLRTTVEVVRSSLPVFGGKRQVLNTGFADIDAIAPFTPGEFYVVGARPSMGKTQFVLDIIKQLFRRSERCLFYSLEQPANQIVERIVGSMTRIDIKRSNLSRAEAAKILDAFGELSETDHLIIDDTPGLTIGQARARTRAVHRKKKLSAVFIDYLQMMDVDGGAFEDKKNVAVSEVSKGLKNLARELGIPVIALSQLNRGVESRTDKRPSMSDLRESGSIEQDADVIAFLYREEYYAGPKCPDAMKGVAEVIIAKNRNGPTGTRRLHFNGSPPCFANLDDRVM